MGLSLVPHHQPCRLRTVSSATLVASYPLGVARRLVVPFARPAPCAAAERRRSSLILGCAVAAPERHRTVCQSDLGWRTDFAEQYSLLEIIGKGNFGTVWLAASRRDPSQQVAVKVLPKSRTDRSKDEILAGIQREVSLWSSLSGSSRFVAQLLGLYEDGGSAYLVQQLCAGGDLGAVLQDGPLPEACCAAVMWCVLSAIRDCHDRRLALMDVKPQNFLFTFSAAAALAASASASASAASAAAAAAVASATVAPSPAATFTAATVTAAAVSAGPDALTSSTTSGNRDEDAAASAAVSTAVEAAATGTITIATSSNSVSGNTSSVSNISSVSSISVIGLLVRQLRLEDQVLGRGAGGPCVVACDFGCSMSYSELSRGAKRGGSPVFYAPEQFTGGPGLGVDVWAAGVMLYLLLSGRYPFWDLKRNELEPKLPTYQVMLAICSAPISFSGPEWRGLSREARDLAAAMLDRNPASRITAQQALQHPWFKKWRRLSAGGLGCGDASAAASTPVSSSASSKRTTGSRSTGRTNQQQPHLHQMYHNPYRSQRQEQVMRQQQGEVQQRQQEEEEGRQPQAPSACDCCGASSSNGHGSSNSSGGGDVGSSCGSCGNIVPLSPSVLAAARPATADAVNKPDGGDRSAIAL